MTPFHKITPKNIETLKETLNLETASKAPAKNKFRILHRHYLSNPYT